MRGICTDGPAKGWEDNDLPSPAPRILLVPHDIDDYLPGTVPRDVPPGTEFPKAPGSHGYRLDRLDLVAHATVSGATEAAAFYLHDPSFDDADGHMPSIEAWLHRA